MAINIKRIESLTRLIRRAFRSYGRSFGIILILGFIGGLFEGFGIAAVIPLFYVATGQPAEESNTIARFIIQSLDAFHIPLGVISLLILIAVLFIGKGFVQFIVRFYNARVVARFEENFRKIAFQRTLKANWPFLMRQKSGHLETVLLYDTERGTHIISILSSSILIGTTFAAYAFIALNISFWITCITLALGAIIFLLLKPIFYRIRKVVTDAALAQKELAHHVSEHNLSLKSIKAMAVENPVIQQAFAFFARVRQARIRASFLRQSTINAIEPFSFIVVALLFLANYQKPGFDIASFAVIMFLIQRMFSYIQSISSQLQSVNEMAPYLRSMMRRRRDATKYEEADAGERTFSFKELLELKEVSFSYQKNKPVLAGINLPIRKGGLIALVGSSGSGKTTIIDLLLRLFEPQDGQIILDNIDARDITLSSWRRHFGYVPQDGVLLDASIRENIRFYSSSITEKDIEDAARQANIYDTIIGLSKGFDTIVGERGLNLSGGQRQRLLLARALARKPDILILDEATSAIDKESERAIYQAIEEQREDRTIIVITHHLPPENRFDHIFTVENGSLKESS